MRYSIAIAAFLAAAAPAAPAFAQPEAIAQPDGFVRVGVARLRLADEADIFVNGVQDPQAAFETPEKWVANFDLGYFVLDRVAVQLAATTPAETPNMPAGSLAGLPNLGSDEFSIFTLTATFHPLRGRPVSPYVGAGVGLQHVWSTEDALLANVEVGDAFGLVLQGGVEVAVGERFGVYAEVRKGFWSADASGDLGPARITADAELDPLIIQAGALFRF